MKLLIYSHFFAPSIGGVETIVLSLARGLADLRDAEGGREFEVTVATQTPADNFDDGALSFRVVRQPRFFQLWRLIQAAHVVHVAGPALTPLFLTKLARKPLVIEHHGYQAICPNGVLLYQPDGSVCPGHFQARNYQECIRCEGVRTSPSGSVASVVRGLVRFLLARYANANVCITHHVSKRQGLPHSSVIYYGIEDPLAKPTEIASSSRASVATSFAFVGRFVPEKGIPVLLEASSELHKRGETFDLQLIGDGPERQKIEAMIQRDNLQHRVRITGYLTGPALAAALDSVQAVVMPSVWEETAGLAAIEHMMRGRPVIASDIGGLGEIVGDAGLKCPPNQPESLAKCMSTILHDPEAGRSTGFKARERALGLFTRERMIEDHARLYRNLDAKAR